MVQQNSLAHTDMQLGRYHLLKRVGRGGMGEVWLAEDPQLHRQVAIKMLPPQNQYKEEDAALFAREAQVVASLNHPHILPVHDYGEQRFPSGLVIYYLVMPYISAGSLADLIERRSASGDGFHHREVLAFLLQAAEAIDYAHTKGMIHRDIKPANMLLRSEGSLLLADFGIALMFARDEEAQEAGLMVGTPLYIAPEQAQGKPTTASDSYSLAVIAYQFVAGRPPFQAETTYATIVQHLVQPPPPPRQWNPDLPEECEAVLLRGLAKKPEERYASAREFVAALARSLDAEDMLPVTPGSSVAPTPALESAGNLLSRRNMLIGAASVLVLGGAAGGIWAMSRKTPPLQTANRPLSPKEPAMVLRDLRTPPDALFWRPDKNVLTTACGSESTIKLWNIDEFRLQNQDEYKSSYTLSKAPITTTAAWSQDGKHLALIATTSDLSPYLTIYSADLSSQLSGFEKGIKLPSQHSKGSHPSFLFVKGIGWLASRYVIVTWEESSSDDSFYLGMWDITQPQLRAQPLVIKASAAIYDMATIEIGVPSNEQSLAISSDATHVALACNDRILLGQAEIAGGQVVWKQQQPDRLIEQLNTIHGVVWSGDGKRLVGVASNLTGSHYVLSWDLTRRSDDVLRFGIPKDAKVFSCLAAYPKADKGMFAVGTTDGKIYLWNGQPGALPVRTLISPSIQKRVQMLAWSPDGQWLGASYADSDVTILIWKI
ncbi:serine/threonine-protein kinase [Ktedonosporobacter rubrisoli]|nr:serine/threonine-protein kinase [Ktedonosporobacter rubrisoli]